MNQHFDLYRPSEEHDMLREMVRSLAEAKIAPYAAAVDEEARFPQEALDALVASELAA
ncbi:acyl-CoA dehydrogenase family protein, partial [Streptomyces sp. NPDC002896]|uniref:acyl-CoA dehydrogenase family protein n=1 Tax=Streptomyces sp. NPDC002896 TaxID=3154438 RepID=UPI00332505FF